MLSMQIDPFRRRPSSAGARRGSGHCESSGPPPAHEPVLSQGGQKGPDESSRAARFMPLALLKPFMWAGTILPWRKTKTATVGADEGYLAHKKQGADEASRKQEMVLRAPSWRTLSTGHSRSHSENQMSTSQATRTDMLDPATRTAVDMLEPEKIPHHDGEKTRQHDVLLEVRQPGATLLERRAQSRRAQSRAATAPFSTDLKRSNTEPSRRDMVRQAGAAFGGAPPAFDAPSHTDSNREPHARRAKGSPATGAGARLLGRVRELRAREVAAKSVAPPKLYGTVIGHAEPVEGFSVPRNLNSVA